MQHLIDTKKEYTEHLIDLLTVPLLKRIYYIYEKICNLIASMKKLVYLNFDGFHPITYKNVTERHVSP